jgi:hypothetical protein
MTPIPGVRTRIYAAVLLSAVVLWLLPACSSARPASDLVAEPTTPASAQTSAAPTQAHKPDRVPGKVMLGSYLDIQGMSYTDALALRRQQLGRDLRIVHWFYHWTDTLPNSIATMPAGTVVLVSWAGTFYAPIIDGTDDALIGRAADNLKALNAPVLLRWAWEMNGDWFDWDGPHNGNNPALFVKAWRHVHDIFLAHGADNVAWVWGPNAGSAPEAAWNDMDNYYPGDDDVDWVAVSGYYSNGLQTPQALFGDIVHRYGSRKPIMIAETGMVERGGTVKADFIRVLRQWVVANPSVGSVVWFDTDDDKGTGANWRIDSSDNALAAFREMASDPYFQG